MSVRDSECFATGVSLPLDVRKRAALRQLESVDPVEAFAVGADEWLRTEAVAAYDAVKADPPRAVPADEVPARFDAKWAD